MRDRTKRFMAESRKKRMSPMAVIIGVIALMTVSAVGAVLLAHRGEVILVDEPRPIFELGVDRLDRIVWRVEDSR